MKSARGAATERGLRGSRDRRAAETRAALLTAALAEFSARGYVGASLTAIADRAGFTKGALYAHFPNKEALFRAVAMQQVSELDAQLGHLGGPDAAEQLGAWLAALLRERRGWLIANAEFTIAAARSAETDPGPSAQRDAFAHSLGRVIGSPDEGLLVLALLNGLIMHAAAHPDASGSDDPSRTLVRGIRLIRGGTP